ncbi:MAG: 2-vinyl bacteriochlorophyllide hydratase [Gammaproteobacteria bacterium]
MTRNPDRTNTESASFYTPEQRLRRDASPWTLVQGILAPLQFLVFLISLALVLGALNDAGLAYYATLSVVLKTLILYAIMVTGSLWEKDVFDRYLFAKAFYWEDMVSMLVLALHTAYLVVILFDLLPLREQLLLALAAYASYLVNAGQFLYKFRQVRLSAKTAETAGVYS